MEDNTEADSQKNSSSSSCKKGNTSNNNTNGTDIEPYGRGTTVEVVWQGGKRKKQDDSGDISFAAFLEECLWAASEQDSEKDREGEVRLCDIIDRSMGADGSWRYYIHYRDYNRRMDEWVGSDRIVSPPSVGAMKVRALTRQKEREEEEARRKRKRLEEEMRYKQMRETALADKEKEGVDKVEGGLDSEGPQRLTRRQKRKNQRSGGEEGSVASTKVDVVATIPPKELDEHEGLDAAMIREHEEVTKVKNVAHIQFGRHQMETWYFSPLPKELFRDDCATIHTLYICEFSLQFFTKKSHLLRYQAKPHLQRHPPGNEIYRKANLSMFEVDGYQERIYCQNLCYFAKFFLDHKTLYYDVDPFLFYVLCEIDNRGFHPVGYFSKEKYSDVGYNLACILTFPPHQRKGYGRFLISFSYELSKKEEKVGSPEKPMSDLGQQAYKPYWISVVVDFLVHRLPTDVSTVSIMDISKKTSIMAEDIIFALNQLGILKIINGVFFIAAERSSLHTLRKKYPIKSPVVDSDCLHWTPFLTDVKRDKYSIHAKKPSVDKEEDVSSFRIGSGSGAITA